MTRVLDRGDQEARLEVREDKCFRPDIWLSIGSITVFPSKEEQGESDKPVEEALWFGSYCWKVPPFDSIVDNCLAAFVSKEQPNKDHKEKKQAAQRDKTRRALEAIVSCAARCGFIAPTFDAGSVADMPFARPTTVVVDTSAVLQGGLDFVVRFLYPMARIKVPAITHMEILNMADRYLTYRHSAENKFNAANAFFDHVTSQAAQRVLLRLELQTETEIERPRLGADPLRGVIQPGSDAEDSALGLQRIQRSFADRLILETAIHHREQLSHDHPVVVLTADQGLARMTLAEGLHCLFFCGAPPTQVCGRTLPATCFRPFVSEVLDGPFFQIPLPALMWELACTFGSARLTTQAPFSSIEISAIGESLSWRPFHSRDDLLWMSFTEPGVEPPPGVEPSPGVSESSSPDDTPTAAKQREPATQSSHGGRPGVRAQGAALSGSYRFSVESMLKLIMAFERRELLLDRDGMRLVGLSTVKRYADFRNFLLAGSFAVRIEDGIKKLPLFDEVIDSIKTLNRDRLRELFLHVPSFNAFIHELSVAPSLPSDKIASIAQSAIPTYIMLAEICCAALDIADDAVFQTPHSPLPQAFVPMALDTYQKLRNGEDYILTGQWLEELARRHGIHPIHARERLNEAREAGLIERYTEGSTPETQFERHRMAILDKQKGIPCIHTLSLYHGDFLIPGKASVSIRLEGK